MRVSGSYDRGFSGSSKGGGVAGFACFLCIGDEGALCPISFAQFSRKFLGAGEVGCVNKMEGYHFLRGMGGSVWGEWWCGVVGGEVFPARYGHQGRTRVVFTAHGGPMGGYSGVRYRFKYMEVRGPEV